MNEVGFRQWLEARNVSAKSLATRLRLLRALDKNLRALEVPYDDLDAAYDGDGLETAKAAVQRLKLDFKSGGKSFRVLMPEAEEPTKRLANLVSWVGQYRSYREGKPPVGAKDADRIRHHVIEEYIEPARDRGDASVTVKVGDVNQALGLTQAWRNICQAISGSMLQVQADVAAPRQEGANDSPATVFTFDLDAPSFTLDAVEGELARRFGQPTKWVQKILAFQLGDGRDIALDRERPAAQLWVEAEQPLPVGLTKKPYAATENRHHGLPGRLSHAAPDARPVAMVTVRSWPELTKLLDWYEAPAPTLNRERLEAYKRTFLERYPDFEPGGFGATSGGYFEEERAYKDALIERVEDALQNRGHLTDANLGARLLDLLTGRGGVPGGLLDWRVTASIQALRTKHPQVLETAAGQLARAEDVTAGITGFVEVLWPVLSEGAKSKPYSDTRTIPTMLAALVHPDGAYGINSDPVWRTYRTLLDQDATGMNPLRGDEYERVLALAQQLKAVMANEWGWSPRDFWDVQGFVWAVNRSDQPSMPDDGEASDFMNMLPNPTNLILYGPPGTGKTYATAAEAVRLCNPSADLTDRDTVMAEYHRLVDARQIEFVTFHQSYSYEEFVEGLRPVTSADGHAGFQLKPEMGAFRRIAQRAEMSGGHGAQSLSVGQRQVFKMSIGEVANPEDAYLFEEALADDCVLLGFGDIDWSDERFAERDAIIEAWRQHEPDDQAPTAMSARVQCPDIFRNWMREGDLVIVSKGTQKFRAIGVVEGPYEYVARDDGGYPHRRAVRWLWRDLEGVPVEEIYAKTFTPKTLYQLAPGDLNVPALERYMASQQANGDRREQFVLIIDEINRANISKVFGELITLLEPDKRIAGDGGGLRVRLPYSRDMFGVPANLHIIGTMNTADRSIALLDTALRRRFEFRELMPTPGLLAAASRKTGVDLVALLAAINERVEYLFDRDHQIGHAYFMGCGTKADVDDVMRHKVIPLLAEYFYEDWTKVAVVLGDATGDGRFIARDGLKPPPGIDVDEGAEQRYRWSVKEVFADNCYPRLT